MIDLKSRFEQRAQRGHINSGQLELDTFGGLSTYHITDRAQERKLEARTSRGNGPDTVRLEVPWRVAGRVRIVGVGKKVARRIFKCEAREFVLAESEAMLAVAPTAPNHLVHFSQLANPGL